MDGRLPPAPQPNRCAAPQDADAVRQFQDLRDVVRDAEYGKIFTAKPIHQRQDMPALPHPQGCSGLIERDESQAARIRTPDQSTGYSQGLTLPPGEGGGPRPRGGKDDPQAPEQVGGLPMHPAAIYKKPERQGLPSKIGRASCRERV